MESVDPATGRPLPVDAIQRVMFVASSVHVYNIRPSPRRRATPLRPGPRTPSGTSSTARLRVIETAVPSPGGGPDEVKTDIVLEDSSTGQLFAAAPYTSQAVVEPALDSSRFFALRVQDGAGRKAVLGVGFEERSESFDFSVALQEARRALGMDRVAGGPPVSQRPGAAGAEKKQAEEKRDYSLKEGETITVNLSGTKFGRNRPRPQDMMSPASEQANLASVSLPPPPSGAGKRNSVSLPPPPGSRSPQPQAQITTTRREDKRKSAAELGFDDGQFGEFA